MEYLFSRYTAGIATPEEIAEFSRLAIQPEQEAAIKEQIAHLLHQAAGEAVMPESVIQSTLQHITGQPQKSGLRLSAVRWWAAAAAVLVLLGAGLYFFIPRNTTVVLTDKAPGGDRAVLTLADGTRIQLDSNGRQEIRQGATAIRQAGGGLQYVAAHTPAMMEYNVLTTPRGGQFRIVLPDGTGVWLNTASSLRYPTAFTGADRTVELQGEAYFEVAANAGQPFHVITDHQDIQVLGTHFNVNAYTNEIQTITTLLEGRVKVSVPGSSNAVVLQPGQQAAVLNRSGEQPVSVTAGALPDVTAWKNGIFFFDNASLEAVMRIIARWYDTDIQYEGTPDIHYTGQISRNQPLSKVITMLEQTGSARFRLVRTGAGDHAKDAIVVLKQ
ncbi:FecR family protein [Chitinophaga solisilvae]|uniref:FecR family protein n=1 Tax=Chitinophaga solisilvae TaxID=1233460 RepID=UPI0013703AEA|nr:FecR family protein [Chitinophaga solisilvae]